MWRQAGVAAFGFGADGIEVDEPRLEDRPRDRLQRLVHPPVQFDLVVQRAEDVGDGALFWQRRDRESHRISQEAKVGRASACNGVCRILEAFVTSRWRTEKAEDEFRVNRFQITRQFHEAGREQVMVVIVARHIPTRPMAPTMR